MTSEPIFLLTDLSGAETRQPMTANVWDYTILLLVQEHNMQKECSKKLCLEFFKLWSDFRWLQHISHRNLPAFESSVGEKRKNFSGRESWTLPTGHLHNTLKINKLFQPDDIVVRPIYDLSKCGSEHLEPTSASYQVAEQHRMH